MMSNQRSAFLKSLLAPLFEAMGDFSLSQVKPELEKIFSQDCLVHMCFPFNDMQGSDAFYTNCLEKLSTAVPDLERRNLIVLAATTEHGNEWVSTMGNYVGTFQEKFLDILPTGHLMHMRFHEFFKFEDRNITEVQAIWDIPELMMISNSWPLAPQLGKFILTPSPETNDGIFVSGDGAKNEQKIKNMLTDLCRHPENPDPRVMNLDLHWHPNFNWYGPAGIGTCRGIDGFRNWHQIPFLRGMPNRKVDKSSDKFSDWEAHTHWISEGDYVSETGWPNMIMKLTNDGWMGIPPVNKEILLRSLDFWRIGKDGRIKENWVLVDLLDMYNQIGVNVFDRMREFNKAKISRSGAT